MKNIKKFFCLSLIIVLSITFYIGCSKKELIINFVQFDIGYRKTANDYYLDFTLEFDNQTETDILLNNNEFYGIVNEKEITEISFHYAYENNYYAKPIVKANDKLTLKVRLIANVNDGEENYIAIYYQDGLIIEDTITISNMNK